ncbi:MAG TPA: hypothetical protein VI384_04335 [Candidatus Dormibacteraeota bacterium]
MKCPQCKVAGSEVIETRPVHGDTWAKRRHWCINEACGLRWTTYEKNAPDPQFAIHKRGKTPSNSAPPTTVIGPPTPQELRGQNPSDLLPDPISSSGSLCDPDLSKKTQQIADRPRARGPKPLPGASLFIAAFCETWQAHYQGERYRVLPKDAGQMATFASQNGDVDEAGWRAACVRYLLCGESFFANARHPLNLLVANFNQFSGEARPALARARQTAVDRKTEEHMQMLEEGHAWARQGAK